MRASLPIVVLAVLLLAGCAPEEKSAEEGQDAAGCLTRVAFDGRTYRAHNAIDQQLSRAGRLGDGRAVDCAGEPVEGSGPLEVRAVRGVAPTVAVAVTGPSDLSGIYVEVDLVERDGLPPALRGPAG